MGSGWPIAVLGLLSALTLQGCPSHDPPGRSRVVRAAGTAHGTSANAALERAAYDQVNGHRRARGLAPLALDPRISQEARLHSLAMADGRTPLGHDGFADRVDALSRVMTCRRSAENVASNKGYSDPASEAVRGWLKSRAHRENIEGPYGLTGIGVARNTAGEVFFTQIFVGR
jgi:uncharacterized protein YkwD